MNTIIRVVCCLLPLMGTYLCAAADPGSEYFPPPESKGGWRKLEGEDQIRTIGGMDPRKLDELKQWLLKSDNRNFAAVVIRHGHIVLEVERGNSAKADARRVASVSKAVCATVLSIASERSRQGKTPRQMSFDDPAFDLIPQAQPLSDPRKSQITVKQLLNHTSGITPEATGARNEGPWKHVLGHDGDPRTEKLAFDPGTNCGYSTFALYHASLVCENVTGKPYDQFAIESLFKPIGCEHWSFEQFEGGEEKYGKHPSHSMGMPARDLARIAYCMLKEGKWQNQQVIPAWFVKETAEPTHNFKGNELRFKINSQTFSHGWELPARLTGDGGTPSGAGIPADARYKPGSGGQLIAFVPSLDLVVTRQTGSSGAWEYAEYLRRACAAVLHEQDVEKEQQDDQQSRSERHSYPKWSPVELTFRGPESDARGMPNPFQVSLDVRFTSPGGQHYRVPGFYDGDGRGGEQGNVWKVRFSADRVGEWTYVSESTDSRLNDVAGRFDVTETPSDAKGFRRWGRLEYTGTPENSIRYLKFRDGPYWLKAGCDDPENFLGTYRNFDTTAERKAAVDYLAEQGINSLYIMTHNIDGDDKDVWPWLGATAAEAKRNSGDNARFDIARLHEWRELFEYMQGQGVVPYLILEDDSAWSNYDHDRYFREIIARFGDLPAVVFNLGEEHNENYRLREGLKLAKRFKELDPYKHPLGIHNINRASDDYIDSPDVDLTSIQTGMPGRSGSLDYAVEHNQIAIEWIRRCHERRRRVLLVNFDEGRPELDRRAWWSAYLGGGVWEAHVLPPYDQPFSAWETTWKQLGGARAFMETLPFHQMQPHNELVADGEAFCLAEPGQAYAFYLPRGGSVTVELETERDYVCAWWNPDNAREGRFQAEQKLSGGKQKLIPPAAGDWAVRILTISVR